MTERPSRWEEVNQSFDQNSRTPGSSQKSNEDESARVRKRMLPSPESAFSQKKVKTEENDDEMLNVLFNASSSALESEDNTDKDEPLNKDAILEAFKSYDDVYRAGSRHLLSKEYARVVDKVLKVTVDHPEDFRGFSLAPALPPFVFKDQEGRAFLEKKVLICARYSQCRKRAFHILDLAAPMLKEMRRNRVVLTKSNTSPIFKDLIDAKNWSQNIPRPGDVWVCASSKVLAKVLGTKVKRATRATGFEKNDPRRTSGCNDGVPSELGASTESASMQLLERATADTTEEIISNESGNGRLQPTTPRNEKGPSEARSNKKAGIASYLEELITVSREEHAHQEIHLGAVPVERSILEGPSRGRVASLTSSTRSSLDQPPSLATRTLYDAASEASTLSDQSRESLAASSLYDAASGEQKDRLERILSKITQVPNVEWDKRLENLRRETGKRRLSQMLMTTAGLPYEEQLALIERAVTEE